jgi:hypothetical protein
MDITDSTSQVTDAVQLAVQSLALGGMKAQGAELNQLLESAAPAAVGSVNSPSQGQFLDAWA